MLHRRMSKELEDRAKIELNEVDGSRKDCLNEMKEWLTQQHNITPPTNDLWLLNYLRGCKFNQERARRKLSNFYAIMSSKCELLQNRNLSNNEIQDVVSRGILILLPSPDKEILLARWTNCDTKTVLLSNVIKVGLMLFDIYLNESETCMVLGHNIIIDCQNLPFSFIRECTPKFLRNLYNIGINAYPSRIKSVHVINCCSLTRLLFNMVKQALPKKIISRVRFYSSDNLNEIYKYLPISAFPSEYGGTGQCVNDLIDKTKQILEENQMWLIKEEESFGQNGADD